MQKTTTVSKDSKSGKTVYRDSQSGAITSKNTFPANRVLKQGEVPKK
jgi:hypothetical protein